MKNNFIVNINYISNFNPTFYKSFNNIKNKNKKKIYCRNLFLFLFLLKYLDSFINCKNITIFIKPRKKQFFNILKAPYKNKLAKNQIGFFRYFIIFKFIFNLSLYNFNNYNNFFFFFKKMIFFF